MRATGIEASELQGHAALIEAIAEHLTTYEGATVTLPGLGRVTLRTVTGYRGTNPLTGEEVSSPGRRVPHFQTADERAQGEATSGVDLAEPALTALANDVLASLGHADAAAVHVPRLGTFARLAGATPVAFTPSTALALRTSGMRAEPISDEALDRALAHLSGPAFGVTDLQAMLADVRSTREPEDDVLVDLPPGLPQMLRAALARSAELGNDDRFGFLSPMHREWAWQDFGRVDDGITPPAASADVFLVSNAPSRPGSPATNAWALRRADLGREDPEIVWCARRRELDTAPVRVRLTTWVQLFALETVLGRDRSFLEPAQAARTREAVLRACPDVPSMTWPTRIVGPAPDPWLRTVELP